MARNIIITKEERERFAFKKGWRQLRVQDCNLVRAEIMKALGITSEYGFYARMYAICIPNVLEYEKISCIFKKYGVSDCWGN